MNQQFKKIRYLIGMFFLLLSSCNFPLSTPPTNTPNQTQPEDTATVATAITSTDQIGFIFLVALEDNGVSGKKIGCDDSLVAVEVPLNLGQPEPWSALSALLSLDQPYFGESGLYNALYQSDLTITEIAFDDEMAKIYLEGELMLGGVCDNPRVEEQILATILQYEQIAAAEVYINGELLKDFLSLK